VTVELFTNLGQTTVSSGGTTAPSSGTVENWTVASSSSFPAASSVAVPPTAFHVSDIALDTEIIAVTNVSGPTWTVTRGAEGTTPVAHTAGFTVKQVVTAGWLNGVSTSELVIDVKDYGAIGDGTRIRNVTAATASAVVTFAAANFTSNDVGKACAVYTDTAAGTITTILSVQSTTSITLATTAGITVSGTTGYFLYGTNDGPAITAAITAAALQASVDTTVGPNQPQGLGQPIVLLSQTSPDSLYIIATQVTVASGVVIDGVSMIANLLTDRFAPVMIFSPYSGIGKLIVEALFGTGIQLGSAAGSQADINAGQIVLWHVGKSVESSGLLRSQDAVAMLGYGFLIDLVWCKGGARTMYHNAGSDCFINRLFAIGAHTAVYMTQSNQVRYNGIIMDSCGEVGGGYSGIVLDNACSDISFEAQAFEVTGITRTLDSVVLIGNGSTNKNVFLRFRVMAQKTGGNVVNFAQAQDIEAYVLASNTASNSSGGSNITNAVVFGTVAGSFRCHAEMNGSITPYTGTVPGTYRYARTGVEYTVQGGAAPSGAAQAANGTGAPAVTVTGNDERGTISFGSGTGPTTGNQVIVTYNNSTGWVAAPTVSLTPSTSAAAAVQPYIAASGTTTFTVGFATAPAASQAAGTYQFSFRVQG
jgi:hypothetical protein